MDEKEIATAHEATTSATGGYGAGHKHFAPGWLLMVAPSRARRFRVEDPLLAAALIDAGAEVVDKRPDVEIGSAEAMRGDAPLAVITIDRPPRASRPLLVRAGRRVATSLGARLQAAIARSRLRPYGYDDVSVIFWDVGHRSEARPARMHGRRIAEMLPERALAIGRRGRRERTMLEAALEAAEQATGLSLSPRWVSVRSEVVVVAAEEALLRAAAGQARCQIENHSAALEALGSARAPMLVRERVPSLLARGRAGLCDWSLERLLPGTRPHRELTPPLLEECIDFLVALSRVPAAEAGRRNFVELAEATGTVCGPTSKLAVRTLGEQLERDLADLPPCFVHGDFFAGNLLAEENRLTGVLDWDAAGPGLPLLDLLHLQLTRVHQGADDEWGQVLLERLLPIARGGGDTSMKKYCRVVGLEVDARLLENLVAAYWLDYVAYQLRTHPFRSLQPEWIAANVELVLATMR
jgi:hypothetical protein